MKTGDRSNCKLEITWKRFVRRILKFIAIAKTHNHGMYQFVEKYFERGWEKSFCEHETDFLE